MKRRAMHGLKVLKAVIVCAVVMGSGRLIHADTIFTVAGTGVAGYNGDYISATSAYLYSPLDVCMDSAGNIYIADMDNNRVRKVDGVTGLISTVAGTGEAGYNGDNIPATSAYLKSPDAVCLDSAGNLYIVDTDNHRIRKVNLATGLISTAAGTDYYGYNGDDILATSANLYFPHGVYLDSADNLYIADAGNQRVRKVSAITGIITTVAGTGVWGYNGDDIPAVTADLSWPDDICMDSAGNLYIPDSGNNRLRKVDAVTGLISTVAGTGEAGYNGDGIPAVSADLSWPDGVCMDAAGNVYIADANNHRVRMVDAATGLISTAAGTDEWGYNGDGIQATTANLWGPFGVYLDPAGILYIADSDNQRIRKLVPNPPGKPSQPVGPSAGCVGALYAYATTASDPDGDQVRYGWDWNGDGTVDEWSDFGESGAPDSRSHVWASAGTFQIQVKSEDADGLQSGWSLGKSVYISLPANLKSALAVSASPILAGELARITLTVTNAGGSEAKNVVPALGPSSGGSLVSYLNGANPAGFVSLAPGESGTFTWTYSVTGAGIVVFSGTATGTEGCTGGNILASSWCQFEGLAMARLSSCLSVLPSSAFVGSPVCVSLTVTNTGNLAAENLIGQLGIETGSILVSSLFPLSSGPVTLNAGQMQVFSWSCTVSGAGTVVFSCTSTGTEEGTGNSLFCWARAVLGTKAEPPAPPSLGAKEKLRQGEFLVAPNVYDASKPSTPVVFIVKGDPGGAVDLGVYDESGEYMGTLKVTLDGLGEGEVVWSGEPIFGKRLGSGIYWVAASGAGVAGRKRFVVRSRNRK